MEQNINTDINCIHCGESAEWFCLGGNIFLVLFKGSLGILSGSMALLADTLHTGTALLDSIVSMIALNLGKKPADQEHPYGHGKAEYISGVFLGIVIFAGSLYITLIALYHLIYQTNLESPHIVALIAAAISIVLNQLLYLLAMCAAKKVNSPALHAEAVNSRSDSFSSIPVIVGVVGSQIGFPLLDPLAAIFIGILSGYLAVNLLIKNIQGLMDYSIFDAEEIYRMRLMVLSIKGVAGVGSIITRGTGRNHWVDLQVYSRGDISIKESNEIAFRIKDTLLKKIKHLEDVNIIFKPKVK